MNCITLCSWRTTALSEPGNKCVTADTHQARSSACHAYAVTAIEREHRPAYVAKRGQYTREARALRRARSQNDSAAVARQEPVVAALAAELKQLRDAQDDAIRALLDPRQQQAFAAYIVQRREMKGASRDERIFD
jgi:hypothetical protein